MPSWLINGSTAASLGLSGLKITYGNLVADVLTFTHTTSWLASPLYAEGTTLVLSYDGVTRFVGKVRRPRRFASGGASGFTYRAEGPWGWLERRALLQNQAIVVDPATSTVPTLIPQGMVLLLQADDGTSVDVATSLALVLNRGIAAGVPILLGGITGFAYYQAWDEVADLTLADAIVRLLASAPDAVLWWDYTTTTSGAPTPTAHLGRRANLEAASLALAPEGTAAAAFAAGTYASIDGGELTARTDLVVPGVFITYRRINTVDSIPYLALTTESAGSGTAADDNALVRTVSLAGSSASRTFLEQKVVVTVLPASLYAGGTFTTGTDFDNLAAFWKRKHPFLADAGVTINAFLNTAWDMPPGSTETPNWDLNNEIVEGAFTPWMEAKGYHAQDQDIKVEVVFTKTLDGIETEDRQVLTAGVLVSDLETQTYTYDTSVAYTAGEPTPTGLAAALYAALGTAHYEGSLTLHEQECTLAVRPGKTVNLTGGVTAWASMLAVVQSTAADLDAGQTSITLGFPAQLGPVDLVEIARNNRLKRPAERGFARATGTL